MSLTIITNNVPRPIVEAWELSVKEQDEFDYLDWDAIKKGEDSATFVRYKDELIDLGDLERAGLYNIFPDWDAYRSDTFFSGILIKFVDDGEQVIMGRYYS